MAYLLKRSGQVVPIQQTKFRNANGTEGVMTRSKVGRAGDIFPTVADDLAEQIENGELDDVWEVVDDPNEVVNEALMEPSIPLVPVVPDAGLPPFVPEDQSQTHAVSTDPGAGGHSHDLSFSDMSSEDLEGLISQHSLAVDGTGAGGNVLKKDMVAALDAAHVGGHPHGVTE